MKSSTSWSDHLCEGHFHGFWESQWNHHLLQIPAISSSDEDEFLLTVRTALGSMSVMSGRSELWSWRFLRHSGGRTGVPESAIRDGPQNDGDDMSQWTLVKETGLQKIKDSCIYIYIYVWNYLAPKKIGLFWTLSILAFGFKICEKFEIPWSLLQNSRFLAVQTI